MTTDDLHEWLSFDHAGETYMLDLTFLGSRWSCIYGDGCPGIDEAPAPELEIGCCSHGAYFSDKPDRKRTRELMKQLGDDEWQYKDRADDARWRDLQERGRRLGHPGRRRRLHLPESG